MSVQNDRLNKFLMGCKKVAALPVNIEHKVQAMTVKYLPGVKLGPNVRAEPDLAASVKGADVLLLCAAGRQYRRDYTRRLLSIVRPEIVVPCHWDDFSIPVEAPPRQLPGVDVEGFVEEIRSGGARAVVLAPLQSWSA